MSSSLSLSLSLSIFLGHVMSPHHSEQISQRSQVSRIALRMCSQNVFVFVFVIVIVFLLLYFSQGLLLAPSQLTQSRYVGGAAAGHLVRAASSSLTRRFLQAAPRTYVPVSFVEQGMKVRRGETMGRLDC